MLRWLLSYFPAEFALEVMRAIFIEIIIICHLQWLLRQFLWYFKVAIIFWEVSRVIRLEIYGHFKVLLRLVAKVSKVVVMVFCCCFSLL